MENFIWVKKKQLYFSYKGLKKFGSNKKTNWTAGKIFPASRALGSPRLSQQVLAQGNGFERDKSSWKFFSLKSLTGWDCCQPRNGAESVQRNKQDDPAFQGKMGDGRSRVSGTAHLTIYHLHSIARDELIKAKVSNWITSKAASTSCRNSKWAPSQGSNSAQFFWQANIRQDRETTHPVPQ